MANAGNTLTLESRSSGFFTSLFPFVLNVDENGANPHRYKKLNKCGPTIYLHIKAEEIFNDWEQLLGKGGSIRTKK